MTKQTKSALNNNLDFIQLKLYDFSDEKIDHEKIISERHDKPPKIENTNQKLFLDENNTFKYDNPLCPVCGSHKIIKRHNKKKQAKYQWKHHRIQRTAISMQKMQQKIRNKQQSTNKKQQTLFTRNN